PHILIVDDEPSVRLVFRTALESDGYSLQEAADGEAALRALRERPADLVLLDLKMPIMDGMEVLRRLRDANDETPVVIVTAHGDVPHAVQAMKLGAFDFVQKPVSAVELRRIAAEVIARSHSPAPEEETRPESLSPDSLADSHLRHAQKSLTRRLFQE